MEYLDGLPFGEDVENWNIAWGGGLYKWDNHFGNLVESI